MPFSPHVLFTLLALASPIVADPLDWVNIDYVCKQSQSPSSQSTRNARNAIIQVANSTAKKGPWSITNSKGVDPPSGDSHDYLSWAPYHWPNCNWCTGGGKVHLVHNGTDNNGSTSNNGSTPSDGDNSDDGNGNGDDDPYQDEAVDETLEFPVVHHRMRRRRRRIDDAAVAVPGPQAPLGGALPSVPVSSLHLSTSPTTTTTTAVAGTSAPPQAAAKTSSCTPSPTKTMPPSATWTTCPYVAKDGKVNPDVRTLNGPAAINDMSQSTLYNAVAYAQTSSSAYCKNVVSFIKAFFLDQSTRMNPDMKFGQVVRGPGASGKQGTFTGILDLRGIVKIVNVIRILKALDSECWTTNIDQAMGKWMENYTSWLTISDLGKSTASKANNHRTFYAAQMAATKMSMGDDDGARKALDDFFGGAFLEQIAASGEQPMEAVRTRPFHYRCFNLEAMITNAKLGDQLGLNYWMAKSRYGTTIQGAVDYVMTLNPKGEDVTELAPHVAAAAAAYGDPDGKYVAFLGKTVPNYQTQPFWYYNQRDAFTKAPGAQKNRREDAGAQNNTSLANAVPYVCPCLPVGSCERVNGEEAVQLDNDIFATCKQLEPLYVGEALVDSNPVVQ